jgi:hypothetical protein
MKDREINRTFSPSSAAKTSVPIGRRHTMMRREKFVIANVYVPIKRRATLKPETVQEIARSILEVGTGVHHSRNRIQ